MWCSSTRLSLDEESHSYLLPNSGGCCNIWDCERCQARAILCDWAVTEPQLIIHVVYMHPFVTHYNTNSVLSSSSASPLHENLTQMDQNICLGTVCLKDAPNESVPCLPKACWILEVAPTESVPHLMKACWTIDHTCAYWKHIDSEPNGISSPAPFLSTPTESVPTWPCAPCLTQALKNSMKPTTMTGVM